MARNIFLLTVFIGFTLYTECQPLSVPKNYFRNPLNLPLSLAANFGELRPAHWHMGLDIRTDQKENQPVYAAADGYVAHIGIRPQSFGRFIIIRHPNGLSTLYGHLNEFFPALEDYVTKEQYQKESWAIELDLGPKDFPVTKGAFIAYSGNTGGSQGPHLHFEIFNTQTDRRYNPLLFDLPITDEVAPEIVKLALYDRSRSVYDQAPLYFPVKKTDSGYIIPKTDLVRTGLTDLSFAIQAFDKMTPGGSVDGIYSARLFLDGQPISGFSLDSLSYEETVNIDAQIDYRSRYNGGSFVQQLSALPGNKAPIYTKFNEDGLVHLKDTAIHSIRIDVKDRYGNESVLSFSIVHDEKLPVIPALVHSFPPMTPGKVNVIERPGVEVYFDNTSLYDTVQVVYFRNNSMPPMALSAQHQVGDASIPLHDDLLIRIKPDRLIPEEWQDKLVIQRTDRKGVTVKKAIWEDKWLSARFGDFGNFQLMADTIAPKISELGKADTIDLSPASRILFTPSDNLSGIKSFRAELDGKWLRFTNDKSRNWIYIFDDRCPDGIHELKVTVQDLVGNTSTKTWWFKKYPYVPPPKKKVVKKKFKGNGSKAKKTKRK